MGQRWASLLRTATSALESEELGLEAASPWGCEMVVPKNFEAQWSIHGMGFGIRREELELLLGSTARHPVCGSAAALFVDLALFRMTYQFYQDICDLTCVCVFIHSIGACRGCRVGRLPLCP